MFLISCVSKALAIVAGLRALSQHNPIASTSEAKQAKEQRENKYNNTTHSNTERRIIHLILLLFFTSSLFLSFL